MKKHFCNEYSPLDRTGKLTIADSSPGKRFIEVNALYVNLIRVWLTGMLFLIPFQRNIVKILQLKKIGLLDYELSVLINRLDEITVIALLPLAFIEFYKNREFFNRQYLILLIPIFLFVISGFTSGLVNGNSLFITGLGVFDYLEAFLVIFIFAAFFREISIFKKIFRALLVLTVFLCVVAFIQEIWALGSRYVFGTDIHDNGVYIFSNELNARLWRFGIYRPPSLMHHPNFFGLYSLLIITIYINTAKKANLKTVSVLCMGIFMTLSRMIYAGFMFIWEVQFLGAKRWLMALIIPAAILFFVLSPFKDITSREKPRIRVGDTIYSTNYRAFALEKGMEVWKDHFFWGVGPGMFGGTISIIYQSPVYEEYNFSPRYSSLDQFWPQIFAEMGIAGPAVFIVFLISLLTVFFILKQRSISEEMRSLFTGLIIFVIPVILFSFGGGFKNAAIFTYSAFAGMGLGCNNKNGNKK